MQGCISAYQNRQNVMSSSILCPSIPILWSMPMFASQATSRNGVFRSILLPYCSGTAGSVLALHARTEPFLSLARRTAGAELYDR